MEKRYYFSLVQTELHLILLFNYYPFFLLLLLSNSEIQTTGHLSSFFFFKTGSLVFETGLGLQMYITTGLHGVGDQT